MNSKWLHPHQLNLLKHYFYDNTIWDICQDTDDTGHILQRLMHISHLFLHITSPNIKSVRLITREDEMLYPECGLQSSPPYIHVYVENATQKMALRTHQRWNIQKVTSENRYVICCRMWMHTDHTERC